MKKEFILVTLHREENTSNKTILQRKLSDIMKFAREKKIQIIFPLMPRAKSAIERFSITNIIEDKQWVITKPLCFYDLLKLEKTARLIVSDSVTVQEEALIVRAPCAITSRFTARPETIRAETTILSWL